jgi:ribose-phosphate pyrophosphokinase
MKLISGSSNQALATNIAQKLDLTLIEPDISLFSNGEKRIHVQADVYGADVCLIQSLTQPVDSTIMETLLLTDALERMGANSVTLVIPWMGYSLQDKVFRHGEPISAKVVANLISNSFIQRVMLMDLHNDSIPAFFAEPTNYLSAMPIFARYVRQQYELKQTVIGSPDFGGLKRARDFAQQLKLDLVNIDKTRDLKTGQVNAVELHGSVQAKTVIMFDDVIVSGGTVVKASQLVKDQGAKQVIFIATHGILTNKAAGKIQNSPVDQVVISNTIHHEQLPDKFVTLDVSPIFAQALTKK